MPTYRYEAMTSSGEEVVDVIEADDSKVARKLLAARGLFVTKLKKSAANSPDDSESEPLGLTRPTFYITKNPFAHGLMCFLGLGFLAFGYGGWSYASYWRQHGVRTVVEIVETQDGVGAYRYKVAGRMFEYPLSVKIDGDFGGYWVKSQFHGYGWGMTVVAFYDANDPEHGGLVLKRKIEGFEMGAPFFLGFGIVCLLAGMAGFAVILRGRQSPSSESEG